MNKDKMSGAQRRAYVAYNKIIFSVVYLMFVNKNGWNTQ